MASRVDAASRYAPPRPASAQINSARAPARPAGTAGHNALSSAEDNTKADIASSLRALPLSAPRRPAPIITGAACLGWAPTPPLRTRPLSNVLLCLRRRPPFPSSDYDPISVRSALWPSAAPAPRRRASPPRRQPRSLSPTLGTKARSSFGSGLRASPLEPASYPRLRDDRCRLTSTSRTGRTTRTKRRCFVLVPRNRSAPRRYKDPRHTAPRYSAPRHATLRPRQ